MRLVYLPSGPDVPPRIFAWAKRLIDDLGSTTQTAEAVPLTDGDKGDVVVSGGGAVWAFDSAVVSAFARTFLDDANAATARATLGAEATIALGTTVQYWRGDKSWQTLDKGAAGLGNVDNTADASKAVLSATKLATSRTLAATGDVTWSGSFDGSANFSVTATIAAGAVSLAKMANLAANSIIGNNSGSAATPLALTPAQVKTLLAIANTDVSGLGTASTAATGTSGHVLGFLDGANSLTDVQTLTKANSAILLLRSGAAGSYVYASFGRTAEEGVFGVAGGVDQFFLGTAAGQYAIRGNTALHLGAGNGAAAAQIKISGTTIAITGTVSVTGASNSTGDQLISGTGAQGYATGSGGTVTQATSKATGVTLSKTNGQIVTHNAALAAAAVVSFVVTNTTVAATDTINLNLSTGNVTAGTYRYWIDKVSAGSFVIAIENRSAGSLSEALTFNFAVVKAVTA